MKNQEIIKLNDTDEINLPKLLDSRLLVQANSGGGKSWLLRRILEQSHGKVQQIVIDLEGEFSTLREKYDYILAGKNGDTPADPRSAAMLAKKLLELNVSAIIDLYELNHYDRKRFVKLFLDAMVNADKSLWHPVLIVIDEAHVFCPEKGSAESSDAVIDLATRGRKRGYCVVLATQRLSKLHKDAAAECNNKLIGRTGLDVDMKRASEELGFNTKEQYLSLRKLNEGQFFAFGPAISREVIEVKVGKVETTHPKAGTRFTVRAVPPTDKIKKLLPQLSDLPAEAHKEAVTISDMQATIRNLTQELGLAKRNPQVTDLKEIEKTVNDALQKADSSNKAFVLQELMIASARIDYLKAWAIGKTKVAPMQFAMATPLIKIDVENLVPGKVTRLPDDMQGDEPLEKITGGAFRMLQILVSRAPMKLTKAQLATFAKLKSSSGSYSNYLSKLRVFGYISEDNGLLQATEKGFGYIGSTPNPPQTPDQVIQMWKDNLSGGAKRMFEVLVERYPSGMSKEELGEATQLASNSGSFSNYISILNSNGLIRKEGNTIKISGDLYL